MPASAIQNIALFEPANADRFLYYFQSDSLRVVRYKIKKENKRVFVVYQNGSEKAILKENVGIVYFFDAKSAVDHYVERLKSSIEYHKKSFEESSEKLEKILLKEDSIPVLEL